MVGSGTYKGTVHGRTALLTLVALALFAAPAPAQEARRAVERFVATLGGIGVTDMVVTQALTLYNPEDPSQQVRGQQRLWIKLPARQRVETEIGGEREVRLLSGDRLVVARGGKVFEAPPLERARHRVHTLFPFRRTAADLLMEWQSFGVRTDVVETVRTGGRSVTVIGAREGDRTSPAVWLDAEYGVVRFITREESADGARILDLAFSEHRRLSGGFFYPFRQEIFLDGRLLSVARVERVEVNTDLPDGLFDPDALFRKGSSR